MSEELRNRNNELSDAELESVGGGYGEEDVQRVCASCLSKRNSAYSCTYEGGDWRQLYNQMYNYSVLAPGNPHTELCPYLKLS